ncbi:MAG TPA: hypothetical protein PLL53_03745 [Saprospiraceae bacterium]|nr:hypothetical protein [Saprospiraceae bacterium]
MKILKIVFAAAAFMLIAGTGFAQQDAKLKEKAMEKVNEINTEIVSVNPKAALTEEQKTQIVEVELQKLKDIRDLKKQALPEEETKEKQKAINQAAGQKISKDILTPDQRKARKEAKEAAKSKE